MKTKLTDAIFPQSNHLSSLLVTTAETQESFTAMKVVLEIQIAESVEGFHLP
jgi:hypothetical protein